MYIRRGPAAVRRLMAAAILLVVAALTLMEWSLRPALEARVEQMVQVRASEAINRAVLERVVGAGVNYADLYQARVNRDGLITFLQPNTAEITRLATETQRSVQQELKAVRGEYFRLPLAQALGSRLFATRGPALTASVEAIGTVRVDVESRFDQAGLNQTRHLVTLRIRADIQAVTPLFEKVFTVEEQVPLAEGIIVGPVPSQGLLTFPAGR